MRKVILGCTGIEVSRLAFGTAYMGDLGDRLAHGAGGDLLLKALELGITFWDTSDDYGSHPHVSAALSRLRREQVVISSKAYEPAGAVDRILAELATDYLDILLVHCVGLSWIEPAREALHVWLEEKSRRRVRALGFSTHSAGVARLAAEWPEVEVLLLPINAAGVCTPQSGIEDGDLPEMLAAARRASELGKGVVAMKVLGGGTLANPEAAIAFAARLPYLHSLCIGMRSPKEIEDNVRLLAAAEEMETVR